MAEDGGRWVLLTFALPTRSKAQRLAKKRFRNWLVDYGYAPHHPNAYTRYLPPKVKVTTELNRLTRGIPDKGTVYVVELTQGGHRRALTFADGQVNRSGVIPELLTVY